EAMEAGDLVRFAELMNVHWEHKKKRSGSMSNDRINQWYELAKANGALGGKLIGAGGGGFLMFYAEEKVCLRRGGAGAGRGGRWRRPACARCASASTSRGPGWSSIEARCRDAATTVDRALCGRIRGGGPRSGHSAWSRGVRCSVPVPDPRDGRAAPPVLGV